MQKYRIDPNELTWSDAAPGLKMVEMATALGRVRLAIFAAGFRDADWCVNEHLGFCLEGEAEVAFADGERIVFRPGDVVCIPAGVKHKTSVNKTACRIVFFRS